MNTERVGSWELGVGSWELGVGSWGLRANSALLFTKLIKDKEKRRNL